MRGLARVIEEIRLCNLQVVYRAFASYKDWRPCGFPPHNDVREGLKKFSDWPTYPQLYVNGELIGGLDIVKEMNESGELERMLPKKS